MNKGLTVFVVLLVLLAGGTLLAIYSGIYDVAATRQDPAVVRWVLHTTMERSVERSASKIHPPPGLSLNDPHEIDIGFQHYNEMCLVCHGAPGVSPGEAHEGLNPKPPNLVEHAREMTAGELFWVIKHGIKMTGMPAWGPTHSDGKIWAMVAFVKQLPGITPTQYKSMQQRLAGPGHSDDDPRGGTQDAPLSAAGGAEH